MENETIGKTCGRCRRNNALEHGFCERCDAMVFGAKPFFRPWASMTSVPVSNADDTEPEV